MLYIYAEAPISGSSARTSIVDKGEVLMWKEAPVSSSSARTSILDKRRSVDGPISTIAFQLSESRITFHFPAF